MRRVIIFALVLLIALTSCNAFSPPSPTTVVLGKEFSLKIGQTATLEDGLVVAFEDVPSDGRCSSCTASFYALISLRMTAPGKPPTLVVLKTPPLPTVEGDTSPYAIKFIALQPQHNYPNDFLNRADYVVTLLISKAN